MKCNVVEGVLSIERTADPGGEKSAMTDNEICTNIALAGYRCIDVAMQGFDELFRGAPPRVVDNPFTGGKYTIPQADEMVQLKEILKGSPLIEDPAFVDKLEKCVRETAKATLFRLFVVFDGASPFEGNLSLCVYDHNEARPVYTFVHDLFNGLDPRYSEGPSD